MKNLLAKLLSILKQPEPPKPVVKEVKAPAKKRVAAKKTVVKKKVQ